MEFPTESVEETAKAVGCDPAAVEAGMLAALCGSRHSLVLPGFFARTRSLRVFRFIRSRSEAALWLLGTAGVVAAACVAQDAARLESAGVLARATVGGNTLLERRHLQWSPHDGHTRAIRQASSGFGFGVCPRA